MLLMILTFFTKYHIVITTTTTTHDNTLATIGIQASKPLSEAELKQKFLYIIRKTFVIKIDKSLHMKHVVVCFVGTRGRGSLF